MPPAWPEQRHYAVHPHEPMDQKVETTTPTTSAWAAIASIELATVSNIRI